MRSIALALCFFMTLTITVGAQGVDELLAQATQPVPVELAIGVNLNSSAAEALSSSGLAAALPARVAPVRLTDADVLRSRTTAERRLADRGVGIVEQLVAAEIDNPVGLWIGTGLTESGRVDGEIRGLNIKRVLIGMGSDVLGQLEEIAAGSGPIASRAASLHTQLSELDVTVLPSGMVSVEGEITSIANLSDIVAQHQLADTAVVTAPGDLPVSSVIPVLNRLSESGLNVDLQATSAAVVTISQDGN